MTIEHSYSNSALEPNRALKSSEDTKVEIYEGDPELTGHSYDGIQEFDNPLPGWWKWLFVATVVASPPYWAFYHFGTEGRSASARYEVALAANAQMQFADIGELTGDEATLVKYKDDKLGVSLGKSVYLTNCVTCHRNDGSGNVGPNLTDQHYKNVKKIEDIYTVLVNGAGGGAMPAWKNRLSQNEIVMVSAYVASMRGTPAGPTAKEPEGVIIPPWPTLEAIAPAVTEATDAPEGTEGK